MNVDGEAEKGESAVANAPRITAKWKPEFDAGRYARALLALVEQLGEQHQAVMGTRTATAESDQETPLTTEPSPPDEPGSSS